ncbi:DHA2 family efflux MFS transporter permease subunit [Alicyclobacillus acidiphilus]|uniref:DHA2 family efflux MFS transporter permease subunit n=1 Tax=Alicyclobacillus acidiphilus TaxID=182455 RepID=UPI0009F95814|nr:DHA2 family efflux MFS transporter permease subunit [Alicyclobacillus acidiphilus]
MSNDTLVPANQAAGTAALSAQTNLPPAEESPQAHRLPIMITLVFGMFIAILNQTLLNVALPHLMSSFNVTADTVQWLTTAYMLTNGVLIPITAFLMGTFSTRQLFISAMSCFTIGTFICSIAPTFSIMVIGRVVQAAGSAIMIPLVMTVILELFPIEQRGRAMGTMAIAMFFAPAIGPTLSGWMIMHWSWRLLFDVVIPLGVIDVLLGVFLLRNVSKPARPKFEGTGMVLSLVAFFCLLYALSEAGSKGWGDTAVRLSLIIGAVFLVLFVIRELTCKEPMLNLRVFRYGMFSLTTVIGALINMSMYGGMILTPIYMQNIRGFSALQSGVVMLPGAILMGLMSPISGALFDKLGARPLALVGLGITIGSTYEFTLLNDSTTYGHIMLLYTIRMLGMSLLMMTVQTAGMNQLPRELYRHGTSASNTARTIASSIGTAILVTVMTSRTKVHYEEFRDTMTSTNSYVNGMFHELTQYFATQLHGSIANGTIAARQVLYDLAEQQSTIYGINDAFWWATIGTAIAFVLSFFIRHIKQPAMAAAGAASGGAAASAVTPGSEAASGQNVTDAIQAPAEESPSDGEPEPLAQAEQEVAAHQEG